jgi:hypothetical protein
MRILVVVGSEQSENLCHRKGKGFLAMSISQELVGPNLFLNWIEGKGKRLIFLYYHDMRGNASLISDPSG